MHKEFLMGNAAIARGAVAAGLNLVSGYPGTPSTEVLETTAKVNDGSIYVEWSVNEKAALELGAGAAYSGARSMVTMKQVGLNVASDPLMSLAYIGVKGDVITDLHEDLAAEQKARTTYDNLLRLIDDPDIREPLKFLRQREIVHYQRFGEPQPTEWNAFGGAADKTA